MQGVGLGLTQASQFLGTAALQAMKDQADVDKLKLANQLAQDNMQVQADIDVGKQGQINQVNAASAETTRQAKAARVADLANGIIGGQQLNNYNKNNEVEVTDDAGNVTNRPASMDDVNDGTIDLSKEPDAQIGDRAKMLAGLQADAQDSGDYSKVAAVQINSDSQDARNALMQQKVDYLNDKLNQNSVDNQFRTMMMGQVAQIRADAKSAGGSSLSPKMQMVAFMESKPDIYSKEDVKGVMLDRPQINPVDIAANLMKEDSRLSANDAALKAIAIVKTVKSLSAGSATSTPTTPANSPTKPFNTSDFME